MIRSTFWLAGAVSIVDGVPRIQTIGVKTFESAFPRLLERARVAAARVTPDAAEDIASEALSRAHGRWATIEPYASAWVARVARNLALDRVRARSPDTSPPEPIEFESDLTERIALYAVLRTLPSRQREAIALRYLLDLPVERVAHELGVPVGTVKQHIHRGIAAMRAKGELHE